MKVALVHDYIKEYGGAERVLESLHSIYKNAPIYTLLYTPKFLGPHRQRFKDFDIRTSIVQYLPFKEKLISPLRIIAPFLFKMFNFEDFDLIIVSSTGAYIPNMINKKKAIQVCYCHTPPRYLYGYKTAREWKKNLIFKVLGEIANHFLRILDFKAAQNVDLFITNSKNTSLRIKKFYRRDSKVIYPPVVFKNSENYQRPLEKGEYFLAGGRLARPKNIDLIIKAFAQNGKLLKIFGRDFAGYGDELKKLLSKKTENIEFLGEVGDGEKITLMKGSRAYIIASEDEDFGITPLESMAEGIPVISYKQGGMIETVIDGKTGVFFDELTVESLNDAIFRFSKEKFDSKFIREHALKFSEDNFKKRIQEFIKNLEKGEKVYA
jgi:glycosyltransferase involved in cell wall biosynthesis